MAEREFVPMSEAFLNIKGKKYDLIRVDFTREHPEPGLVAMTKYNPGELVARTDPQVAQLLTDYVNTHLDVCNNGCKKFVAQEFKTY